MEKQKTVSVIGAGVAGLASAIRLQHAGYTVELFEKEDLPGGKMNVVEKDGYRFDLGPSLVMMPELYREPFELAGKNPDDYIPMERLDPMYVSHFNKGKETIEASSDLVKLISTMEAINDKDAQGFLQYLQDIYERFIVARDHFLQRPFRRQRDFYQPSVIRQALKLKTFDSASHSIGKYIEDERLQQMLSFQTLYIGVSPKNGPSLYTIIPMIELLYGVWFIKGGMHTMAEAMEKLLIELGGKIHYQTPVEEILIENQKAVGLKLADRTVFSDFVMCNADFPYAMKHLVKDTKAKGKYTDKKIDRMKYSCSCLIFYWGMDRQYDEISPIHHFVFSEDLDENIDQIFDGRKMTDPSFYVYMASKLDPTLAPAGKDGLYVLIPVSELSTAQYQWTDETIQDYRQKVLNTLSQISGFENVEQEIVSESYMTPEDFKSKFNAYNGACFGLQPNLLQSNHFRPQSKATHCENLYFTGSSTHPGAGVPIVLLSAKIAVEELLLDDQE